jgi:hypothetical protein
VFVLCFVAVMAALTMHRRPRPEPARIHLAEVQQRNKALRQEVEQARAAPDPADASAPQTAGSIADLSTDAAALLRQLPGVVDVEVLVTCPKPTHRIIHLRDWHCRTFGCGPRYDGGRKPQARGLGTGPAGACMGLTTPPAAFARLRSSSCYG